jgi:hypothetical protein
VRFGVRIARGAVKGVLCVVMAELTGKNAMSALADAGYKRRTTVDRSRR